MKNIIISCLVVACLASCKQKQPTEDVETIRSVKGAVGPYIAQDNNGNAVLCWSEMDTDSLYRLKFAVYDDHVRKFRKPMTVPGSAGMSTSPESMGKVAFKSDGTIFAIYPKRFPEEKNPYAGAIYYSSSTDHGENWSASQFLHSDTIHTYGRSFFDVTTLKDGEIAAIWLDGRYGKNIKGSALFFNRTYKGRGFGQDTCLEKGTCECCRTDILSDRNGNIHLAYRNITFPSKLVEKQVRDMGYKVSINNGKSFSPVKTISNDNWQIEGCPHSGPSLAVTKDAVNAVWFTAGGGAGIYSTSTEKNEGSFRSRTLVNTSGRHPQQIALANGKLILVYEELKEQTEEKPMKMEHSGGQHSMAHSAAANSKVMMRIYSSGDKYKEVALTDGLQPDHHAVAGEINKGVLIAWVREAGGQSKICYKTINVD